MALDGELVHVTVEAEGENLTYEWWYATPGSTKFYKSSITTATYSTRMDATRDGRQLYCIVKDESGNSVQSDTVTISLRPAILITSQPEDAMAPDGDLVRVTVEAEGEGLTYEWWYALAGSTKFYKSSITTATYTTRMDATRDGRQLYCIVKDENGNSVQTETVRLILITGELTITQQPQNVIAEDGEPVEITIKAEGAGLTYEWWVALDGETEFQKTETTGNTYILTMDDTLRGAQIYCVVVDIFGRRLQSDTVMLLAISDFTLEEVDDGLRITGYTGEQAHVTLPSQINGQVVVSIGEDDFRGNDPIGRMVITDTVTAIAKNAFRACKALEAVAMGEGISTIQEGTFAACTSLNEVYLPSGLKTIDDDAFAGCVSLTALSYPEGLTRIGRNAFEGCTGLLEAKLPDSVTTIGERAFRNRCV